MRVDAAHAERFLNLLWPGGGPASAYLVLSHIEKDLISEWITLPKLSLDLGPWLNTYAPKHDTYYGVGLRDPRSEPSQRRRGGKISVCALPGLVVDLDDQRGRHKQEALPQDESETLDFLQTMPWQPSLIVDSSGGLHAYWLFREPFVIETESDRDAIQELSQRFRTYVLDAGKERHQWKFDPLSHLDIILRLPGSLNHKTGTPIPVQLIREGGERYNPSDFEDFLPPAKPRPKPPKGDTHTHGVDITAVAEYYGAALTLKNKVSGE